MKAAAQILQGHPSSETLWMSLAALARQAGEAHARRRARRVAASSLRGLSERTLKDIGIHRTEIGSVVHGSSHERMRSHDDA